MFESKRQRPIAHRYFVHRLAWTVAAAAGIAAIALAIGVVGFHFIAHVPWIDALHNAAMLLGGMGPVAEMDSDAAKLFSSAYALFCGLVFIGVVALMLAPVMHRIMHKFHIDDAASKK